MASAGDVIPLEYPCGAAPAIATARRVVEGVWWLRLPLAAPLGHINVWLLDDGDSWTVVDTGVHTVDTFVAWRAVFAEVLRGRPIGRVLCTHMHPDHIGMAGWLADRDGGRLWCTQLEYLTCRLIVAEAGSRPSEHTLGFYRRAGWSDAALDEYAVRFGEFGKHVYPLPDTYRRIADGEHLVIGGHTWRVVVGRGHSPEHACLHCPALGVLISGDQVLPRISSNVSVFPREPEANPLEEWMASLRHLRADLPAGTLVLPAHGEPFVGLHARLDELLGGHEVALERLWTELRTPLRAIDTFQYLYKREIGGRLFTIATGESLAHLNWLVARGGVDREADAGGIEWYRRTS